jgi:hypothetical protein
VGALIALLLLGPLPAGAMGEPPLDLAGISTPIPPLKVSGLDSSDSALIQQLWGEFVSGLPAQAACLLSAPPQIVADPGLGPRAAYAPSTATLYVRPHHLERLVVFHELGHHLDFTCGASEQIGAQLRRAQGIAASKPWWKDGNPVTWPAEYFANAVAITLGEKSRHDVSAATVELVGLWTGHIHPQVIRPARTVGSDRMESLGPSVF